MDSEAPRVANKRTVSPSALPSAPCRLHELRTKFKLGGTFSGLYRVLGGFIRGYATNLVQGSHEA